MSVTLNAPAAVGAPAITLSGINHTFVTDTGTAVEALRNVSFGVAAGKFIAVVGPSGCGKSTLLNIISGLLVPTAGHAVVDGRVVNEVRHDVGYMPAHDSLLPWRTVLRNVEFPLEMQGVPGRERRERALESLASVGLRGFEQAFPHALSMGMRQRVAIARIFATKSSIVLMDEPFGALDAQTRVLVQDLFLSIWQRERRTVVLITHDISEAVALADVVVVFSARPGQVIGVHEINLPRPRSVEHLIFDDESFQRHIRTIWAELRPQHANE